MMSENSIEIPDAADREIKLQLDRGCTVIYVADTDKLIGYIALSDTVREESSRMISEIKRLGITPVLLTGDNEKAAAAIASQLEISEVKANCLPENKLEYINGYQSRISLYV